MKWLKSIWLQIAILDFDFDLESAIAIDVLSIAAGGESGIKFIGSFFQLYWEPADKFTGRKSHLTGDFLYLEQLLHHQCIKDMRSWWRL